MAERNQANELFSSKAAEPIYSAIVGKLKKRVGTRRAVIDPKQTCVHICAGKEGTAYAGLHPRKGAVLLNIRLEAPLNSPRVRKTEQVSRNRFHCEILITNPAHVDAELLEWLACAANLAKS